MDLIYSGDIYTFSFNIIMTSLFDNCYYFSSFFGGSFGFRFGQADDGHREIPRGGTITMDLEVHVYITVHCVSMVTNIL